MPSFTKQIIFEYSYAQTPSSFIHRGHICPSIEIGVKSLHATQTRRNVASPYFLSFTKCSKTIRNSLEFCKNSYTISFQLCLWQIFSFQQRKPRECYAVYSSGLRNSSCALGYPNVPRCLRKTTRRCLQWRKAEFRKR